MKNSIEAKAKENFTQLIYSFFIFPLNISSFISSTSFHQFYIYYSVLSQSFADSFRHGYAVPLSSRRKSFRQFHYITNRQRKQVLCRSFVPAYFCAKNAERTMCLFIWCEGWDFRSVATIPAKQSTGLFFRLSANTQINLLAPYSSPIFFLGQKKDTSFDVSFYLV